MMSHRYRRLLVLLLTTLCVLLLASVVSGTEVKWTANEADNEEEGGSGPLPLSSKQRQQLLQLEEVIRTSPNPEATLKQAADANGMSPQDLMAMLQRNRSDLEQGGGVNTATATSAATIGGFLKKVLTALFAVIAKSATQNPRAFALITTTLLLMTMLAISAPRTGLIISSQRGILSRGPTTLFQPPNKFLEKQLSKPKWQQHEPKSQKIQDSTWKDLNLSIDNDNNEAQAWRKKMPKDSDLAQAATFQINIPIQDFIEDQDDQEEDDNDNDEALEFCHDLCYNHAVDIINAQQFTEFAPANQLRLYTLQKGDSGRKRFSVLVVKKLGDWGRFGIVPLLVTHKNENERQTSILYSALKGAPFAGQIRVTAEKRKGKKGASPSVLIVVHLAFPKKAHRIPGKAAMKIVQTMTESIAASLKTRTRQSIVRRSQSSHFKGKVKVRAEERRHTRFQKEKDLEEMAEDRRRKWQRNNPNSGRYTPSGDRQKSPNNC
ncbi:expressed unknown protein [Seminavis robusta]|uniref:Uncharacterized protein n=1 Tax=Seminavis robusta TaxID=568900 RepID=A0A9N8EN58_9STRA|nr:expressed unknown protein [Seminavis robusta]|eukprot:Sro1297_g260500.1 n/a (491) ;mRNA; r:19711-21183